MVIKFVIKNKYKSHIIIMESKHGIITKFHSPLMEEQLNVIFIGFSVKKFIHEYIDKDLLTIECLHFNNLQKNIVANKIQINDLHNKQSKIIQNKCSYLIMETKVLEKQINIIKRIVFNECEIVI